MRIIPRILSILSLVLLASCGGNSAEVGTGADLSTLSPQPTGLELWQGMESALGAATIVTRLGLPNDLLSKARPTPDPRIAQTFSDSEESTATCPGGGTIDQKTTFSFSETSGNFSANLTYNDCASTMILNGQSYSETFNGNSTAKGNFTQNQISFSSDQAITISGDLGLAANCDFSGSFNVNSFDSEFDLDLDDIFDNIQGECVFEDAAGTKITVTAEEVLAANGDIINL